MPEQARGIITVLDTEGTIRYMSPPLPNTSGVSARRSGRTVLSTTSSLITGGAGEHIPANMKENRNKRACGVRFRHADVLAPTGMDQMAFLRVDYKGDSGQLRDVTETQGRRRRSCAVQEAERSRSRPPRRRRADDLWSFSSSDIQESGGAPRLGAGGQRASGGQGLHGCDSRPALGGQGRPSGYSGGS